MESSGLSKGSLVVVSPLKFIFVRDSTPSLKAESSSSFLEPAGCHGYSICGRPVPGIFAHFACPNTTPATINIIASQKVGVMGSFRQTHAHAMVLNGIRLLNKNTWLVFHWRSAL